MTTRFSRALAITLAALSFITAPAFAQDTIKVGMSGRYFPFTFVQKDVLQGFEVDVWNEIGKRADLKVEFKTANFSGLFGMLEAGHIDTISNQITITDERLAKYDFAQAYVIDGAQIVVKKGRTDIQGIDDLKGKKVAVNLGSNFEQLLRKADPNKEINIITYDAGFEQDVVLGRTDAFVMDRVSSAQLIKKSGLPLELAGEPFETIKNAMPFIKSDENKALITRVNTALTSMREDGSLSQISQKWFNADITK
ncbi:MULTISPECIES: amino acid ABC transporter substrate-binding protein [unclassified Motilimonas]|uniref:amino acid ABC transporter substrate-binding protein n=1 Tax=unclassified Motilimonas TaxID=2643697 RepID=UPI001E491B3E|nr:MULTISPECIES: amino acid ABC transporter substrate-binding protein [unclassified Motilimonas]MDO6525299.1 amino acid ABC transporter substrate-binding protein [Motilimonas sp. 1_MG-2023]